MVNRYNRCLPERRSFMLEDTQIENMNQEADQKASDNADALLNDASNPLEEVAPAPRRNGASERALRAAIEIFTRWENDQKNIPLDRIVSGEFRTRKYLNSTERRWVAEVIYNCARFWRRQVFVLEALGREATAENVVRLWAEEEKFTKTTAENLGAERNNSDRADSNADLSNEAAIETTTKDIVSKDIVSKDISEASTRDKIQALLPAVEKTREYLRITLSFPDEMAAALEATLGEEAIVAAHAFNMQAPTTLRVNPLRVSWAHLRKSLPEATPTIYSPWGLELPRRVNVFDMPGYRTGWFEVQEEASQLVSLLIDAQPGQAIAEIGAGAGGKTLAIAALMENKGEVFALDINKSRLEELAKRAERAGVTCVQMCETTADFEGTWQPSESVRRTVNKWRNRADAVLVDAPCTGSGVLRRSPDAKWRDFDLTHMTRLQSTLLAQAATLLQPDGYLFYVSCAFERTQNEDIVEKFLKTEFGEQFEVVPAVPRLRAACARARYQAEMPPFMRTEKAQRKLAEQETRRAEAAIATADVPIVTEIREPVDFDSLASGPYLRTWPHRHGLDAFFAACLHRKPV